MLKQPLKKQLIDSLVAIGQHTQDTPRIEKVIKHIKSKKVEIPETSYNKVADFILLLISQRPEILDLHPYNQPLFDLCLHCLKHYQVVQELRTKNTGRKR